MSLIAVCAGKGAPGASFVALNLAAAWARAGSQVLLADLDTAGGDLAAYLRLDARRGLGPLLAMHANTPTAAAIHHEAIERAGMQVLAGVADATSAVGLPRGQLLGEIRSTGARAVCDLGRIDVISVSVLREADQVLVVVRPDLVSVLGAQRALGALRSWVEPHRVGIVLNACSRRSGGEVAEVTDALGVSCLGVIPFDPRGARLAMRCQQPVSSKRLVAAFEALGQAVCVSPKPARVASSAPALVPARIAVGEAVAS